MATTGLPLSSAERARDDARRAAAALLVQQAAYNPEILPRISQYCGSSDLAEKMLGLAVIDGMITEMSLADDPSRIVRLASNVLKALPCSDAAVMAEAARVFARLTATGGLLMIGPATNQLKIGLEWLQGERIEARRWAAVYLLLELANQVPNLVYDQIPYLLDNIWTALRDPRNGVREVAALVMGRCLDIAYTRDGPLKGEWYKMVYDQADAAFRSGTPDNVHAAILAVQALFVNTQNFMNTRYTEVCDRIIAYMDHRDPLVRRGVIDITSTLASYETDVFVARYLHKFMVHLLSSLHGKDRAYAFQAIGKLALTTSTSIVTYVDGIVKSLKEALAGRPTLAASRSSARGQSSTAVAVAGTSPSLETSASHLAVDKAIFNCISMLATALGQVLTKYMHELLDLMFANGITQSLVLALQDISHHLPPLLDSIQRRLLDQLAVTLSGDVFHSPGEPYERGKRSRVTSAMANGTGSSAASAGGHGGGPHGHGEGRATDDHVLSLALVTLGTFDFSHYRLGDFVREHVVVYLEHEVGEVRVEAALACARIFAKDPMVNQVSAHAIAVVSEVLEKLLTVAIADPDPAIRLTTLQSLDPKFDKHLAQAENVRTLFLALNDEAQSMRQHAIGILGRLSHTNPGYVLPFLRKTLIQLLTELEYSTNATDRDECARLLSALVDSAHRLTRPYVLPMLKVLLPKARDRNPKVASSIMIALGELVRCGGDDVRPQIPEYMSLIKGALDDHAFPIKRESALRTLGQLASHAGYVIDPYLDYPGLLNSLIATLQTEQNRETRHEAIKAMGVIGAIDPYRHTAAERAHLEAKARVEAATATDGIDEDRVRNSSDDSYFPGVAFRNLLGILNDKSLTSHHAAVVVAIMYIFRSLRLKCVQFLRQIIPSMIGALRTSTTQLQEFYFQHLGELIAIVKQHIRNHLGPVLALIGDYWEQAREKGSQLQIIIIDLVDTIAAALEGEFKVFLPTLLPPLLSVFEAETTDRRTPVQLRVLKAFATFGLNLEEYLHLVVPVIVRTFERPDAALVVRKAAIETTTALCRRINFADFASRIIHPLSRVLRAGPSELRMAAMKALCALLTQIGSDYAIFIPLINRAMITERIIYPQYDALVNKLLHGEPLPQLEAGPAVGTELDEPAADAGVSALHVNQVHLKGAWIIGDRMKADDWREWIKRIGVQMLKVSPSHSLRACASLGEVYQPLARDLFNAAFAACWDQLYPNYKEEFITAIEAALSAPSCPVEVMQILLNLAEFMEHEDKILPIPIDALGRHAIKCNALAKALHYKELECQDEIAEQTRRMADGSFRPGVGRMAGIVEDLIRINNELQQPDVANGILRTARDHWCVNLREDWYEKLERWEDALVSYQQAAAANPEDWEAQVGQMRCFHAQGDWESLSALALQKWPLAPLEYKRKMGPLAAAAAWGLCEYDAMDDYIAPLKHDSPDRAWFRAVLNVHRNQVGKANGHISKARDLLDPELTSLVGESYTRAYNLVVRIQMLSELEEVIQYKDQARDQTEAKDRRVVIQRLWEQRLRGCQRDVEVWQRILKVRSIVLSPRDNMPMWIKFANLCRKSGRLPIAEKTINSLLNDTDPDDHGNAGPPHVIYTHLKLMWAKGEREDTLAYLRDFATHLAADLGLEQGVAGNPELLNSAHVANYTHLLARCYFKLGEWTMAIHADDWSGDHVRDVLSAYLMATRLDATWYKGWHAWALANSEVVAHYVKSTCPEGARQDMVLPPDMYSGHLVPSIEAFFRSIALSAPSSSLQDTLRLLTLWFRNGQNAEVSAAIHDGFASVPIDTWLEVTPQLIARIHSPHANIRRLIQQVLCDIGRAHPQSLVYALTVASKYPSAPRRRAALAIIDKIRDHSRELVSQALLVSEELIRVAILWHEQWHVGLEEASRLYYGEQNTEAMFATLDPLNAMLDRGPETLREVNFVQTHGRELNDARDRLRRYRQHHEIADLNAAWELYYHVFKRVAKQILTMNSIDLQYVSPKLLAVHDLELAVPGTYLPNRPIVRIQSVSPTFQVLSSKQHPRKLTIKGSDGLDYTFLLKGHEDLRQDERVMQLFGLVNTLLARDPETFKRHLTIQKYSVIPLSPQSGLIGWVPDTDTLHVLVKEYRESKKILLNIEHRLMLEMAPNYEQLSLIQKTEVFDYALDNTTGQDLYRVLWLKSKNSEVWLERRSSYSRSLAVMSMVGHILGLGDRHPSNLLLDRHSGMVVHVDFGDCFETAMMRDKYPEKVPFRLTRMLVRAMEVSGIEGTFRTSCEHTMRVMRENRESILAVLEAFIYDPLINWRLVTGGRRLERDATGATGQADDGNGAAVVNPGGQGQNGAEAFQRRPVRAEDTANGAGIDEDAINQKAMNVLDRVTQKLNGRDCKPHQTLSVEEQVAWLIVEATRVENLCGSFVGWCAFW